MKKLLIFDFDGTLIDSAEDVALAANVVLERYSKPQLSFQKIASHMGTGPGKLVLDLFPEIKNDKQKQAQLIQEYLEAYRKNMTLKTKAYPGVFEFLDQWQELLALVTNKPKELALPLMQELGFNKYQWVVQLGANSLKEKKPSALPLQKAMELAQVSPEQTVMIGDGLPDVGAAQNAGVTCIAAAYGYTPVQELLSAGAQFSMDRFEQLPEVLEHIFN